MKRFFSRPKVLFSRLLRVLSRVNAAKPDTDWCISQLAACTREGNYEILLKLGEPWLILDNGIRLHYNSKFNSVSGLILKQGSYERREIEIVLNNLSEGSVFFDVGANVGIYSLHVARSFENVRVYAFEPVLDTLKELEANLRENALEDKVNVIGAAVARESGRAYMTTAFHSSNYLSSEYSALPTQVVECVQLDAFTRENSIDRIDLIKVDVEGRELSVLRGAEDCLRRFHPLALVEIVESPPPFADREVEPAGECIDFMVGLGYSFFVVDDDGKLVHADSLATAKMTWSYHDYLFYWDHSGVPSGCCELIEHVSR